MAKKEIEKREKAEKIIDIIIKSVLGRKMTFYKLCLRIIVSAAFFLCSFSAHRISLTEMFHTERKVFARGLFGIEERV